MADNFEDDKDNKEKKKDSADFAQIMNVVNDIKGRVKDLNPVTFESLKSMLANVLDAHPEFAEFANIKEMFEQLELTLKEEEQRVKSAIAALINEENRAAEVKRIEEEAAAAAEKLREGIERRVEVAGVYKAFDSFYPEVLNTQRKDNENLHEVFKATKSDRPLTEAEKEKFKKKPEQIAKEKAHSQHMELTKTIAKREHKYHSENLEKVNKEIADRQPHEYQEIAHLVQKKDYHEKGLSEAAKKKEQYEVFHNERCQYAKNLCLTEELAKEKGCNEEFVQKRARMFEEIHGVLLEKMAQITTEEKHQKNFIVLPASEVLVAKPLQQKLDTTQIASNHDERASKHVQPGDNIKQILGGNKDPKTQLQNTNTNIKPDNTPVNPKIHEPNKGTGTGRGGRL